jgi:hypothetical protein
MLNFSYLKNTCKDKEKYIEKYSAKCNRRRIYTVQSWIWYTK